MRKQPHRPAFTLVELLVVIGIIAVLIGVLLPVLGRAREAGNGAVCLSNLRGWRQALSVYESQNRGLFTANYDLLFPSKAFDGASMSGSTTYVFRECPTWGAMAANLNGAGVAGSAQGNSYGYSVWFSRASGSVRNFRVGTLNHPSELILRGDTMASDSGGLAYGSGTAFTDSFGFDRTNTYNLRLAYPTFQGRHNGRGGVLWMDGHATLEQPNPVPLDGGTYDGLLTFKTPAFYNKLKIGYLVPAGTKTRSLGSVYYFLNRKELIQSTPPLQWFTVDSGSNPIPRPDDWR